VREANQDFPISSLLGRRKSEEGGRKEINTVERERRASCRNVRGKASCGLEVQRRSSQYNADRVESMVLRNLSSFQPAKLVVAHRKR
jgi:hypothetical protein